MMSPLFEVAAPEVWVGYGLVVAFVAVSSAVVVLHPRLRGRPRVRGAVLSWWPVSFVAALATLCGSLMSALVLAIVSAALAREALRLLRLPGPRARLHVRVAAAAAIVSHALVLVDGAWATTVALAVALAVAPVLHLMAFGASDFVREAGGAAWVTAAAVGLFSFVARTEIVVGGPFGGPGAAFVFFVLVMMSDAMQYVGGKLFGRHVLLSRVSPGKTWEGLLFGLFVCTTLGACVTPRYLGLAPGWGAGLGAAICLLGLCGDLVASAWKRDAGVKDSSDLLPGQGGLLDRCDSVLFAAPWYYLLVASRLGGG